MMKQHLIVARMTIIAAIAIVIVVALYAVLRLSQNFPWAGFGG